MQEKQDVKAPAALTKSIIKNKKKKTKQSRWPFVVTVLLLSCLVAAYFLFPTFQDSVKEAWNVLSSGEEARITKWVEQFGYWGPVFIIFAMVAQMFLLVINVVVLMLVAIITYGPVWGSVIAIIAVLVASSIGYWLGQRLGKSGVSKLIGEKTEGKVEDFMEEYGVWAIIIARISPFLSNDAVSFVAGIANMNYFKFILATLAGIVPLTLLLAWMGENNDRLKSGLIWVSAISLAMFIGYILYNRIFKK